MGIFKVFLKISAKKFGIVNYFSYLCISYNKNMALRIRNVLQNMFKIK